MNILRLDYQANQQSHLTELLAGIPSVSILAHVESLEQASEYLHSDGVDLLLSDLNLGDSSGLGTVHSLLEMCHGIPLVVCGDSTDLEVASSAVRAGAQDYLIKKDLTSEQLLRSMQLALQRQTKQRQQSEQSHIDPVSGLKTRQYFQQAFRQMVARARRNENKLAVMSIYLPEFEQLEALYGIQVRSQWVRAVSQRLSQSIRENDLLARSEGGHFMYIMEGVSDSQDVMTKLEQIQKILCSSVVVSGREVQSCVHIGVSTFPENGSKYDVLIDCSETAMHQAMAESEDYRFFTQELQTVFEQQQALRYALAGAIQHHEFGLNFQPVFDHDGHHILGLEALLRWNSDAGEVSPASFLSVAEDCGLILEIGEWVLSEACRWLLKIAPTGDLYVSVNVSKLQFHQPDFVDQVNRCLEQTGLSPQRLELEIKEEVFLSDPVAANQRLNALREKGVRVAVDDFGLGYFSLNVIKDLAIDRLKIDQSFIRGIGKNANDEAVIKVIISLAHSLSLTVIAEGVERQNQHDFLLQQHCDALQGYHFSYPIPPAAVSGLLSAQQFSELG